MANISNRISLEPSKDPGIRRACRLLAMVHELHKAGYQRLRICSGMSPAGTHWRCHVTPAENIATNGWEINNWDEDVASYSTGDEDRFFGFNDAPGKSARELAAIFVDRFPRIATRSFGQDWPYAGWFTEALGAAEHGNLPIFFADYDLEPVPEEMPPSPDLKKLQPSCLQIKLISNDELRLEDVPLSTSRWEEIEPFCLTYDGYADGRRSVDECGSVARQVFKDVKRASMDELRIAMFFQQRKIRWNDQMPVQAEDVNQIRPVIEEVRLRLTQSDTQQTNEHHFEPAKLTWEVSSKFDTPTVHQAEVVASSIQELNDVLPWEFEVETIREVDRSDFKKIFQIAEYLRFMSACYACGFVMHDARADFPLDQANARPDEVLGDCDLSSLRHYLHSLCRDERWSDGYASPVLDALISGSLQIVGKRLMSDTRLR